MVFSRLCFLKLLNDAANTQQTRGVFLSLVYRKAALACCSMNANVPHSETSAIDYYRSLCYRDSPTRVARKEIWQDAVTHCTLTKEINKTRKVYHWKRFLAKNHSILAFHCAIIFANFLMYSRNIPIIKRSLIVPENINNLLRSRGCSFLITE